MGVVECSGAGKFLELFTLWNVGICIFIKRYAFLTASVSSQQRSAPAIRLSERGISREQKCKKEH